MLHVVMTTYAPADKPERAEYASRSIRSLNQYLRLPNREPFMFHISDDGSDADLLEVMYSVAAYRMGTDRVIVHHDSESTGHTGIGGSLNRTLSGLRDSDIWMYTTDDWMLTEQLDLTKPIQLILGKLQYDIVRVGSIHPGLLCRTMFQEQIGWWLHLEHKRGGFAFATRPFIARVEPFLSRPFLEFANAYDVERDYAIFVASGQSHIYDIAAVVDTCGLEGPWEHIGKVEVGDTYP